MTEVEKRARILMGEAHLRLGHYKVAERLFADVNSTQGLIACGSAALEAGQFLEGSDAFSTARVEMPREGLITCGHVALRNGHLEDAMAAFSTARVELPVEGLIVCGTKALEAGRPATAKAAFEMAAALELGQPS